MAMTENTTGAIAGYFQDHDSAERAVQALREAGFTSAHLGVAHRGGSSAGSGSATSSVKNAASNVGAKAEGVWDKVKNFFEGGSAEPYATERSEGDLGTRTITSDNYDYDHSDFHNNLTGLNVPEDRSRYLGHRFGSDENGAVVTVNAGPRNSEAEAILRQYGADLGENASTYDYSSAPARSTGTQTGVEGTQNIQLLGEILRVQKERISRGEVTLRKEVITENQTVQVPVTREELVIERHAADGSTPASGTVGETGEIRIPLTEERASIDKSTVVREEVSVGKRAVEETRDLSGQVSREELVVEDPTNTVTNTTTGNNR